jgi:beta-glucosidase
MEDRITTWLEALTLEEKVAMLAGESAWYTVPVERLGIPRVKVTDGPNGARGEGSSGKSKATATCFPVGIALAASWNRDLIEQVGAALAEETRSKAAHVLLAPTVNIHRSPLNGRNFECYSEDPYLTAEIAVAYIQGIQREGVGATIKHFVCNDSEFQRKSISSEVDDRALREIYLPPFKAAVDADVWAVMTAYNRINGTYASEHEGLVNDLLKGEWGFDGLVMSDWTGTYSAIPAVQHGVDLEMPGPTRWRGEKIVAAVQNGDVDVAVIDDHVRRLLRTILRVDAENHAATAPEQSIDDPAHRALARRAATEAIVLLKNDPAVLPLDAQTLRSVAIIGPNAKVARIMGGGSSQVPAHYRVTPFEGVMSKLSPDTPVHYELGCLNDRMLPVLDERDLAPPNAEAGEAGLAVAYFDNLDLAGEPVVRSFASTTNQIWFEENPLLTPAFSARFTSVFTPASDGTYGFSLTNNGPTRVLLDGEVILDHWTQPPAQHGLFSPAANDVMVEIDMAAGQAYTLTIEHSQGNNPRFYGFRLGCKRPDMVGSIDRAVDIAQQADVALVFAGLNGDWESEGGDRRHMDLVGEQDALIAAVAAANPNTVVVLNTGSPITMPWLDDVAAVVEAWFGGQETGNAMADVLFGAANPSGKLPETFPVRLADNPAFINYPGENGKVRYGEGIFVGYRYYEKKRIAPLFPFGFGLSYTTFAYDDLRLSADAITPDQTLTVQVDVTNTGQRAGQEVVQLYVRDVTANLVRPLKELKGFAKVALESGETKTVSMTVERGALAYYDDLLQRWIAEAGAFEVLVGSSSQDIRATAGFTLTASHMFGGPLASQRTLTPDSLLGELLRHDEARARLEAHCPDLLAMPQLDMFKEFSLTYLARMAPEIITDDALARLADDLATIRW